MHGDAADREEIDLLIRALAARARAPLTGTPPPSQPPAAPTPAPRPFAQVAAQAPLRPGRRWTNARFVMPSRPAPGIAKRLNFDAALSLPQLFDLTRVFSMPGPVTMARMWVGLGAAYSASLTFWPYPKTYLWGMVLYLLCLGLALVASVWSARLSWDSRLGAAHTIALGTTFWAITLATVEALRLT